MLWYNALLLMFIGINVALEVSGKHPLRKPGPLLVTVLLLAPLVMQLVTNA